MWVFPIARRARSLRLFSRKITVNHGSRYVFAHRSGPNSNVCGMFRGVHHDCGPHAWAREGGTLGLLGFGGKLVLGFLQPITFILIQKQVAQSVGVVQSAAFMTLVNIFFSILQAVIVIMLLTALLIGRPNPNHTSS